MQVNYSLTSDNELPQQRKPLPNEISNFMLLNICIYEETSK